MKFDKTVLSNGLRVITVPIKDSPSVMVLVAVETGSDYESKEENGLSHFLEHLCFKGTVNRPGVSIIGRELDSLGAENNSFTSREWTGYYARAARKHFHKIFEIVSDLYLNPTLPAEDLEKERGVILEELSMYEDLPQRKVWNVLSELMYGDTPAGRTTLGLKENIKNFKRENFVVYRNKHYVARKTIIAVAGDINKESVLREVKKHFINIPMGKKIVKPVLQNAQKFPALAVHRKKTDQTHMIVSFRGYKAGDKREPALALLAEILGKGMSSRLFTKLRDEMGACYYVSAINEMYKDRGRFNISTGINSSRIKEVIRAILAECINLSQTLVSESELSKAKEHLLGHLYMGVETTDAIAEFYTEQEVLTGKPKTPKGYDKLIRNVRARDVMSVAKDIFKNDRLNLAIVGAVSDEKGIKRALKLD